MSEKVIKLKTNQKKNRNKNQTKNKSVCNDNDSSNISGLKMIKQIKTEINAERNTKIKRPENITIKSNVNIRSNTISLIRSTRIEKKRKIINLNENDFINNRYDLDSQAYIEYYPNFITTNEQNDILVELTGSNSLKFDPNVKSIVPWQHGHYSMYGKYIQTPRLLYAMRDADADITNSYKVTESMFWTKEIANLREQIKKKTHRSYRYAQMNLYRTGDDYIGFHTDSEVGVNDIIVSVSIGAERTFRFISTDFKENSKPMIEISLESGSLLIMNEYAAKHNWKHELSQDKNITDMRINITFRSK